MAKILKFKMFESQDYKTYFDKWTEDYKTYFDKWTEDQKSKGVKFRDWFDKIRAFIQDPNVSPEMKEKANKEHDREQESGYGYQ